MKHILYGLVFVPLLIFTSPATGTQSQIQDDTWADARRAEASAAVPSREALTAEARILSNAGWSPFFAFPEIAVEGGKVRSFDRKSRSWREAGVEAYLAGTPNWSPLFTLATVDGGGGTRIMPRPWNNLLCAPSGRRCLIAVTSGGFDEIRWLEVDTVSQAVPIGGFDLPPSRASIAWIGEDALLVTTGRTSTSGYPLEAKIWRRGTPLDEAETIYSAGPEVDALFVDSEAAADGQIGLILPTAGTDPAGLVVIGRDGSAHDPGLPIGYPLGAVDGQLAVSLTQNWRHREQVYPSGSLLSFDLATLAGGRLSAPEVIFESQEGAVVGSPKTSRAVVATRRAFYFTLLQDGGQAVFKAIRSGGRWRTTPVIAKAGGVASLLAADAQEELALVSVESPISPPALYRVDGPAPRLVRYAASYFDTAALTVERGFARANDGARIPYWLVRRSDAQGPQPTIIHAYGAANVPLLPSYRAEFGRLWLARGGSYVIAQVRGGGEYGRAWYEAGSGERSGQAVDDLIAVADALISRGQTTPAQLGLFGFSAGGALVTSAATIRPDLFAGVVSQDGAVHPEAAPGEAGSPARQEMLSLLASEPGRRVADRYWPARAFSPQRGCPNLLLTSWRGDQRVPAVESRALAAQHETAGCRTLLFEQPSGDHGVTTPELLGMIFGYFADRLGLSR